LFSRFEEVSYFSILSKKGKDEGNSPQFPLLSVSVVAAAFIHANNCHFARFDVLKF
jgi:hypothetical protein